MQKMKERNNNKNAGGKNERNKKRVHHRSYVL